MSKQITVLCLFCIGFFSAKAQPAIDKKAIIGTWRLVEFADYDSASKTWSHRYGKNPKGYFIYTAAGYLSINVSNEYPLQLTEEEAKRYNVNFYEFFSTKAFAYFGTYTFEPDKGSVTHHVKGGSIPWYIDTEQPRQIQLKGDTAIIGDNIRTRRVLVRVE
ncbi:MAG: lipocalin-like domain-containing protein [Lacibacter sp.]|jgi:hypothetical protein